MCTVSFVKSVDKIIITSNRDEAGNETVSNATLKLYQQNLIFPKDTKWAELGML
jgi:hypothetical protein